MGLMPLPGFKRPSKNPNGREKELTEDQRRVVRELKTKGQSYEELAVGFGVSFNTIRNICAETPAPSDSTAA